MKVKAKDLQPGDTYGVLQPDLSVTEVAVVSVEPVRSGGSTRYKVQMEGEPTPRYYGPTVKIEITRSQA